MELGRLRAVREARGRSLRSVAREVGIDASHLSRIERGMATPSVSTLVRIARVLGLAESADGIERVLGKRP